MIFETQTIFALMSLATQMIFALMIQKTNAGAGAPPSPASTAKKRKSKITPEMVANIKWLAEMPVSFRDIQRKYFPQLSVQSIALVARYGCVPSTQKLLDLLAEQGHLTQRQVSQAGNRNLGLEIEQYEPAPRGAFNNGLGSGQNRAVIAKVVRDTRKYNKVEYPKPDNPRPKTASPDGKKLDEWQAFCKESFGLQKLLNEKNLDPIPNRCRQLIRDKWQELKLSTRGHEGTFDSIATICLSIIRQAGPNTNKLKLKELVDAAFFLHFPDQLAAPYQQLRCKHCRTLRGFMIVKDQAICLKCGTAHPNKPESFKMVVPKINPEYSALLFNLLKSRGGPSTPAVEEPAFTRPPLTPLTSRDNSEESDHV